ncbi:MAG TPA: PilZ domain-containing protein [Anaeromyxobacter sp.]|nr:PilZ domain-containing protein [Anaeromyxobacter sp.]
MLPRADVRRAPRLLLRVPALLAFGAKRSEVVTEDFAAGGCQLATSFSLRRGQAVYVTLSLPPPAGALSLAATVAWSTPASPHRIGLEFTRAGATDRERLVQRLVGSDPALAQAPALRPSMRLRLGRPPHVGTLFSRPELDALRAARDGVTAEELLGREPERGRELRRAVIALLARGLVEEGRLQVTDAGWARLLAGEGWAPPESVEGRPPAGPARAALYLELARAESAAGRLAPAVEWLQAALHEAPEHPGLAEALDTLTVGGDPGAPRS